MLSSKPTIDFDAIKLKIASPEEILSWSHGEVLNAETINYRTQKPERDGLFCEKIFGPIKDYECHCGKYKKIRYKGIICDRCGVEVTKSIVRRERMAHIKLAAPVAHIWYVKGVPSRIGLFLNLSLKDLEKVIYFAGYIIKKVNEDIREQILKQLEQEYVDFLNKIENEKRKQLEEVKKEEENLKEKDKEEKIRQIENETERKKAELKQAYDQAVNEVKSLRPLQILSEAKYNDISMKYGAIIEVGIGAEAIRDLLSAMDLKKEAEKIKQELIGATGQKYRRLIKRLRLIEGFIKNEMRPEWMILTVLPVIPPDLRPVVQLDGGRFATSDLNDLYRRVINRNNRLKKLIEIGAPEVICRNEKRMLQEAVDALIDNSAKKNKAVTTASHRKLRSLSDILRGKQGRFRQNLLGKRVDYSGRSVIVVGPDLKLHQCGLPKVMALELFKPFVISQLIRRGYAHNVRSASQLIEKQIDEVWDILEEITKNTYVLLNRAPTLHRLGIQSFQPVLIEGKAIQIHPLVCLAYNADFDGDQMAVHVPLSSEAQKEAAEIMLSEKNLLKPASGEPIVSPTQDIVLGCYYLTSFKENVKGENKIFSSIEEAFIAYQEDLVDIHAKIKVKIKDKLVETSIGRLIFNQIIPEELGFKNEVMDKKNLRRLVAESIKKLGYKTTALFVDQIKKIGFRYVTRSGLTLSIDDIVIPKEKKEILKEGDNKTEEIKVQFQKGLITEREHYTKNIDIWKGIQDRIEKSMLASFDKFNPAYMMINSGSRGSVAQLLQLAGMKGLVVNPAGEIIELPIKANYKEGLSALEYFISTHGARKGRSDTALRTSDAGYLTRRLVDVSQDVLITQTDCGTKEGLSILRSECEELGFSFYENIVGRVLAEDIIDPQTGKLLYKKGTYLEEEIAKAIDNSPINEVKIRSVLECETPWGLCQECYGMDLATGKKVELGTPVGIMAAQAIGEPGTQLTMRTFHIGGVVGEDITQGLPRVEELFEARTPRYLAVVSDIDGKISIEQKEERTIVRVTQDLTKVDEYILKEGYTPVVKDKEFVKAKQALATCPGKKAIRATAAGIVSLEKDKILVKRHEKKIQEYFIPRFATLAVSENEIVKAGQPLTDGHYDLKKMLKINGRKWVQKYILKEIQQIYSSQGQTINNKHIEIIIRQMLSKVRIKDPGDSDFLPGEIVDRLKILNINEELRRGKKKLIDFEEIILGITKAALKTESFLSAASFQETTGVLIEAATTGMVDNLRGLKENVIIGRLIPAGTGFQKPSLRKDRKR